MKNEYYLRIENSSFGFVLDEIHEIKETDIKVTDEEYKSFFESQSEGKQFRAKENPTGIGLFDYLEEYKPLREEDKEEYTLEDYALDLEFRLSLLELGGV